MAKRVPPNESTRITETEVPVIAEIARLVVALLAAFGIVEVADPVIGTIVGAVGGLISIGLTLWTRRNVTPTAAPRVNGVPLVPRAVIPPDEKQ